MASAFPEYDAAGTMIGGSLIHASLRDWGKFGELLRHNGSNKGVQLVPRGWIRFMESPSPRAPDYGAQLWLNRRSGSEREVLFAERGPADLVGMVGHLGQYVLVAPSRQLTVVRLGKTGADERKALEDALGDVVAVYSGK
jgi:CubicO group peptidase (beta-lactamase class C family)